MTAPATQAILFAKIPTQDLIGFQPEESGNYWIDLVWALDFLWDRGSEKGPRSNVVVVVDANSLETLHVSFLGEGLADWISKMPRKGVYLLAEDPAELWEAVLQTGLEHLREYGDLFPEHKEHLRNQISTYEQAYRYRLAFPDDPDAQSSLESLFTGVEQRENEFLRDLFPLDLK